MKSVLSADNLILAIDPSERGVGFVVMKGPKFVVEEGVKSVHRKRKNSHSVEKVGALLSFYRPTVIVCEDCSAKSSRRHPRIRRLLAQVEKLAESKLVTVEKFSPADIREAFAASHAANKYQIAVEIAKSLPDLAHRLPPPRRIWMPEHYSMSIFDAAALALTFFHFKNNRKAA